MTKPYWYKNRTLPEWQSPVDQRCTAILDTGETVVNCAECVADYRAQDHQSCDNNNGNQNKDERVLDQTLASFLRSEQHGFYSPFAKISQATQRDTPIIYSQYDKVQGKTFALMLA